MNKIASIQKRSIAYFLDEMVVSVVFLFIIWEYMPKNSASLEEINKVVSGFVFYMIALKILYHSFFVWLYGATLGKMALKIEVISQSGNKINFFQSFNRAVFRIVSEIIFYLGFALAFLNQNKEALHDKTAKTLVVNA
jgi:uncharacterized RDD family membrane protein YckC